MTWNKLGLLFTPNETSFWQKSHAALPTSLKLTENVFRIYFTSRDENNATHIGFFDWKAGAPGEIIYRSELPVLSPGRLGMFDDHGVQATSVVRCGDLIHLYYLGWNIGEPQPLFYTAIGLAISEDNGVTFKKYSEAPIMERSKYDPWMVSGGTVLKEGDLWRMWYISGISFEFKNGTAESKYDIKYATSKDGIHWDRDGTICLPLQQGETNISRMSIIKEDGFYHTWFPVKSDGLGYRIGFAVSKDGIDWERKDHLVEIDVSKNSWDSDSLDKLEVILHNRKKYMLYNGNDFGKEGIGLAIYE
ncbi:hypothetical protein OAU66_01035 [bacterium]|nr:hypothetical protein [bacterium]